MKKIPILTLLILSLLLSGMLLSCSGDGDGVDSIDDDNGTENIIPSNLTLFVDITGADANYFYGNGSGVVNFSASATNAARYGFKFDNEDEIESLSGNLEYTFTDEGINSHSVSVFAYSSTNNFISSYQEFTVYVYESGLQLVWSDEFNIEGAPNPSNWNYNTGAGGWGNNELQTYTDNSENVIVEEGVLKIIARADASVGYTSARIKSENLYEFTYGTIEVRAKLPAKQGTWPAIWLLGANFDQIGWPACGEIDIMEQTGWDKNKVLGTCHWSFNGNYAGYGLETSVSNASTSFKTYKLEWTEGGAIRIFVDNNEYFVMTTNSSMPFNEDFFIILNIAIGGNLGGDVDPSFTEDSMEIDYVRVYQ
ncbi:MAG: glycoside hydrolase family 16 protein [Flavobacteriaceae bacterium]|nr:glycoside hydrolase family 16 protein [Bacteroidia bacterium]NNL16526.1 glycoside hydrolase family 16 protein [Flavobacteriaceae bacterium]